VPLPNAPSPKESNVYKQLSSSTLDDLTNTDYEIVRNPVFIDSSNEDELRRLKLVGEITGHQSSSGAIADDGGVQVVQADYDAAGPFVFAPVGEVWRIQCLIFKNNTDVTQKYLPQICATTVPGDSSAVTNADYLLDSGTNVNSGDELRLTDNMLGLSQELTLTSVLGLKMQAVSGSATTGNKEMRIYYVRER
jgi:hypothetical protein